MQRFWQGVMMGGVLAVGLSWYMAEQRRRRRFAARLMRSGGQARQLARLGWRVAGHRVNHTGRRLRSAWQALKD